MSDVLHEQVEVLLLTSQSPLSVQEIMDILDNNQLKSKDIKNALEHLEQAYKARTFYIQHTASGYAIKLKSEHGALIQRFSEEKPVKYSQALLETLAIIAYKQPVTRGDIENIRGVGVSSQIMKTLTERGWIKVAGQKDVPGKPSIYVTTKSFLDYFNLKSLTELPPLAELKPLSTI